MNARDITRGTILAHRVTGVRRMVTRITPAGAAGTRVSDGPVFHATVIGDDGNARPGGHTADIWTGSMSYPLEDWQAVR